jgi:hypothetical protein
LFASVRDINLDALVIGFLLDGTYQWPILSYRVSFLLAVSDNILCAAYGSPSSHIALYHGAGGITAALLQVIWLRGIPRSGS